MTTAATAGQENDAIRLVMTSPSMKGVEGGALTPRLRSVGRGIRRLREVHWRRVDDVVGALGHQEWLDHLRRRARGSCAAPASGATAAAGHQGEERATENHRHGDGRTDVHVLPSLTTRTATWVCSFARPSGTFRHEARRPTARRGRANRETIPLRGPGATPRRSTAPSRARPLLP